MHKPALLSAALLVASLIDPIHAVKTEDWKLCHDSSFCRRLRALAARESIDHSPYSISGPPLVDLSSGSKWSFPVSTELYPEIQFQLNVSILSTPSALLPIARITMDEVNTKTQWKRYDEASLWSLVKPEPVPLSLDEVDFTTNEETVVKYGAHREMKLVISHSPLKVELFRDDSPEPEIILNDRSLLHIEHFRTKETSQFVEGGDEQVVLSSPELDRTWFEGPKEEYGNGLFEEKWKQWEDKKPKGPEALSLDITFPTSSHVYGIPEHASPLSLPGTDGTYYSEPYRLYNVDIFEYEYDSPRAMYGAVPLLHAHSEKSSVGLFYLSGSETWIDVSHPEVSQGESGIETHWMSESGILDVFLLAGPTPSELFKQFSALTGPSYLAPEWSLGHHQCRWNYIDTEDVLNVQRKFNEGDFPLDVTWLDIEYATEHKYFDWDKTKFDPVAMLDKVEADGRKMVAIIDPHIKRTENFYVYKEALELDIIIKNSDKSDYEGWCWTGSSSWVDFFNERSWRWWADLFQFSKWPDSTKALYIWNDMNEPSVFNGPEITMPKDNTHQDGKWEHRDVHNINGMLFQNQTAQGLIQRESPAKRPFVLSRSFFAGSQRFGAIWTGDNLGTWEHLKGSIPMLLTNGIAGMTFSGADVGGFFGNPDPDFLVRFYQAGAFMPFFRAHAHIDTRRREPYLLAEPFQSHVRDMLKLRYAMLPVWYTAFREAAVDGTPILRPQYVVFPKDAQGFAVGDQFYVGRSGLLVKPVVDKDATETTVYFSDNQPYYDYFTHQLYPAAKMGRNFTVSAPLNKLPLFHQGGTIVPLRLRARRSSPLMWQDPFTLVVAVGRDHHASGELYVDDGDSYNYESGEFVWRGFEFVGDKKGFGGVLKSSSIVAERIYNMGSSALEAYSPQENAWAKKIAHVRVEKIVVLGLKKVSSVTVAGEAVEFEYNTGVFVDQKKVGYEASELIIKNPPIRIVQDWEITIS